MRQSSRMVAVPRQARRDASRFLSLNLAARTRTPSRKRACSAASPARRRAALARLGADFLVARARFLLRATTPF